MERKLRDKFIDELQKQKKIENYEIKIRPIIREIIAECDDIGDLGQYSKSLHPATIAKISARVDQSDGSSS